MNTALETLLSKGIPKRMVTVSLWVTDRLAWLPQDNSVTGGTRPGHKSDIAFRYEFVHRTQRQTSETTCTSRPSLRLLSPGILGSRSLPE